MLNDSTIIDEIFILTGKITDTMADKLRMEEEMLWLLLKCKKQSLKVKTDAYARLEKIQKMQLELMGQCLNKVG